MSSEAERIKSSTQKITSFKQVAPTMRWIRLFENKFKNVAGAQRVLQLLTNQLKNIEL